MHVNGRVSGEGVELPRVNLYVFNQYAEQDDGVLRFVTEWPLGRGWDG